MLSTFVADQHDFFLSINPSQFQLQCNYFVSGAKYCAIYALEDPMCHMGDLLDNARKDISFRS